ncbi:mitochondrial coenzyme A diphosphatase NUDT8-like [Tubulanus polymorphus]|uniref:mitochondrial coenzyme A diphosphatase NUDT8-like n=1 Tax=Tubulanus polymorphus TaxID=672921 RepID=UPI003DA64F3E
MDPTDITLINTAVREAEEELGIDKSNIDVWGQMNPGIPPRGAPHRPMVFGVIANLGEIDVNKLDVCKSEVEFVFTRTIRSLCDPRNYGYTKFTRGFTRSAVDYAMPVFTGLDRDRSPKIWGITAIFVHYTLKLLAPNLYRGPFVKVNE